MLLDRWMGRLGRHPLRLRQGEARALNLNMKRCGVQEGRGAEGESSKPIRELALQLQRNKGTFIIQLGTCQGSQKKKTSNLVLQGEDAQKSGLRVTGTNKRRTKLITRVHCIARRQRESEGEGGDGGRGGQGRRFKAGSGCPVI